MGSQYRQGGPTMLGNIEGKKSFHEAIEELADLYGVKIDPEPLLTIELQDANSIPTVYYGGKEITNRCQITFDWVTKEADKQGGVKFHIEYIDENGTGHIISKRAGDFA